VAVALVPHLQLALPQVAYYFRDFTLTFYPLRLFQARELAAGRWPFWNPYLNEGTFLLPVTYPLDFLHALWPGPAAVSCLLTLHFPLAALFAYALARDLGAGRAGAFVAGSIYSMGGLAGSSLNLYVFLQALALAPLVVLTLRRAALQGGRWIAAAAVAIGLSLTTLAVEFVGQALLLGIALALVARRDSILRVGAALCLGVLLAGVPIAVVAFLLPETSRAAGFAPVTGLSYEVHPFTLLQSIFPQLLGSPGAPLERWWGGRFFPGGFPYFATIYVGPLAVALALAGSVALEASVRRTLLALAALGLWYAIGSWGGLAPLLASVPVLRFFRFPSKALLLPFLSLAIFAGFGAQRLARGEGWGRFVAGALAQGGIAAAAACALFAFRPALDQWLAVSGATSLAMAQALGSDCGRLAGLCAFGASVALAVRVGRLNPRRAVVLLGALAVTDLAEAGRGLNPVTSTAFFRPLPEIASLALDRLDGGRVFSYGAQYSPRMRAFLATHERGVGLWAFFANRQMLAPFNNVLDRVETAEGLDRTSFLPRPPALAEPHYDPGYAGRLLPVLREAAVSRVLSLDPLDEPELRLLARVPVGVAGLEIHAYELAGPWPRRYVACRTSVAGDAREARSRAHGESFDPGRDVVLEGQGQQAACGSGTVRLLSSTPGLEAYAVSTDGPGYLVTRDSYARGWTAMVAGAPAPVLRANGKDRAVRVPGGASEVVVRYAPPGLRLGLLMFAAGLLAVAVLLVRPPTPPLPRSLARVRVV
jgi:hypothetical protein